MCIVNIIQSGNSYENENYANKEARGGECGASSNAKTYLSFASRGAAQTIEFAIRVGEIAIQCDMGTASQTIYYGAILCGSWPAFRMPNSAAYKMKIRR